MRLPITTDELEFIVATPPTPVPALGRAASMLSPDRDDAAVYTFNVLATSGVDADVLRVQVDGPIDVAVGEPVRLRALTVERWEKEERSGVSFRAEGVERSKGTRS